MAESNQQLFAFGDNQIDGHLCIVAQSEGTTEAVVDTGARIAEMFDRVVRDRYPIDEGLLTESVAKSCWRETRRRLKKTAVGKHDRAVQAAEDIERSLF